MPLASLPTPDYQAIFEASPALYLVLTPDFTIVAVNDGYLRATMTSRADILGRGLFDVFPDNPDDPTATGTKNLRASLERVLATQAPDTMALQKYDIRQPGADGGAFEERFWSPVNSPVIGSDHTITYIIHRVEDVTEFVRLKEHGVARDRQTDELQARAAQMETEIYLQAQEIEATNRQLEAANRELHAVNRELEAFSYSVSHDLRAPLRSISGFSQALLEDYADRMDAEGREYLQHVVSAGNHMALLIDDLLRLARLARAELKCEPTDLSGLAHAIAEELQRRSPNRVVTFIIPESLVVFGDAPLLRIVLENLLENAWKFTRNTVEARIEFGSSRLEGSPCYFVRDNGAGFAMVYADKLFGAFQRLHSAQEYEGAGIGLATVQRIVHRHGGRIWAEAVPGQGATFSFTLA